MPTPDADTLRGLVERVRAAKGPDRDLDLPLYCAVSGEAWEWVKPHPSLKMDRMLAKPAGDKSSWDPGGTITIRIGSTAAPEPFGGMRTVPAYTTSLDAALALVERALPSADYEVRRVGGRFFGKVRFAPLASAEDECPTAPLAILAALLTGLLAQTEGAPDAER